MNDAKVPVGIWLRGARVGMLGHWAGAAQPPLRTTVSSGQAAGQE